MTGLKNVEHEIVVARQSRVPVLITAPPGRALAIAQAIAKGMDERQLTEICDGAAIVRAAGDRRKSRPAGDDIILVVREVHALSAAEQAALMEVFDARGKAEHGRIIATSSVCLWDLVQQGQFDAELFYRLNVIHIVSQSDSDHKEAGEPCCSGGRGRPVARPAAPPSR